MNFVLYREKAALTLALTRAGPVRGRCAACTLSSIYLYSRPWEEVLITCIGSEASGNKSLVVPLLKTVAKNWDSKTPSVGTILAYLGTTNAEIFGFLF